MWWNRGEKAQTKAATLIFHATGTQQTDRPTCNIEMNHAVNSKGGGREAKSNDTKSRTKKNQCTTVEPTSEAIVQVSEKEVRMRVIGMR